MSNIAKSHGLDISNISKICGIVKANIKDIFDLLLANYKGYFLGGLVSANTYKNTTEDLIFSNETSQTISATLDAPKRGGAGVHR